MVAWNSRSINVLIPTLYQARFILLLMLMFHAFNGMEMFFMPVCFVWLKPGVSCPNLNFKFLIFLASFYYIWWSKGGLENRFSFPNIITN
jgi:hypothetical protein